MKAEHAIITSTLKDLHLLDMMWFFSCRMDGIMIYEVTKGNDTYTLSVINDEIDFLACDTAENIINLKGLKYIELEVDDINEY